MTLGYWKSVWQRMQRFAGICRYGHQDFIKLLGHHPTPLELALFSRALSELVEREFQVPPEFRSRG